MSLIHPRFILIDLYKIGTHEIANNVHDSQTSEVVESLKKSGYKGPAISVFEKGSNAIYESTADNTFNEVEIEYGRVGVADGHNRLAALKELDSEGSLKSKFIPVQIIPARNKTLVQIRVDDPSEKIWTIEEIEAKFANENDTMQDSKNSSHFEVAFKDGSWGRIRDCQPDIEIPLLDL